LEGVVMMDGWMDGWMMMIVGDDSASLVKDEGVFYDFEGHWWNSL
jgi:hypothetical protein